MSATITEHADAQAAVIGDENCESVVDFLGAMFPCPMPATGRFIRTCACKHVREGRLCELHAELSETGCCLTCFELPGPESHECPITLVPAVQS